eukprot:4237717-Pyramimonas_sp.AAC.1
MARTRPKWSISKRWRRLKRPTARRRCRAPISAARASRVMMFSARLKRPLKKNLPRTLVPDHVLGDSGKVD